MKFTRKTRLITALLALFSMLFMQLAVAAYACPGLQMSNSEMAMMEQAQSGPASMPGCVQPDPKLPALCQAHCQDAKQSLDKAELPPIHPALPIGLVLDNTVFAMPQRPSVAPVSLLARNTSPPLSIRNCCFRI